MNTKIFDVDEILCGCSTKHRMLISDHRHADQMGGDSIHELHEKLPEEQAGKENRPQLYRVFSPAVHNHFLFYPEQAFCILQSAGIERTADTCRERDEFSPDIQRRL